MYIYSPLLKNISGVLKPSVMIGPHVVWSNPGYYNGTATSGDFADAVNDWLSTTAVTFTDEFGNSFVDVRPATSAKNDGSIHLFNLTVFYDYNATTRELAPSINNFLKDHQLDNGSNDTITVPFRVMSRTPGRVRLSGLCQTRDFPPALIGEIGNVELDEDTANARLLDLHSYFMDDTFGDADLIFSVSSSANPTFVDLGISDNRFLSADALTGDANDNWTGVVRATVHCSDPWGQRTESNEFSITVRNVNDPPVITSIPPRSTALGANYSYQATALDGDNDPLSYSLEKAPPGMAVDGATGLVLWKPEVAGYFNVSLAVSDGNVTAHQNFSILVIDNWMPEFTSIPIRTATAGREYTYTAVANDGDGDPLAYSLVIGPEGMAIGPQTGILKWTPKANQTGNHSISVGVSDGTTGMVHQAFVVNVQEVLPPSCSIVYPTQNAKVKGTIGVRGTAINGTDPVVQIRIRIDDRDYSVAEGQMNWTAPLNTLKLANGRHELSATASDGNLTSNPASVDFNVDNPQSNLSMDISYLWAFILLAVVVSMVSIHLMRKRKRTYRE